MLHWDDLKYLLALEQHGNLIKAAKSLNTNPTTVSRHIKRLSENYRKTLIARTHNGGWELTDHGRMFSRAAQVCQQQIQQLEKPEEISEYTNISVSTVDFIAESILAPRIRELQVRRKRISLTLETADKNVSLAFGEADLAVRLGRPKQGRLIASKICNIEMSAYAPADYNGSGWVGLAEQFEWVPEMQAAYRYFGCPPSIRMGTFTCLAQVAVERGLACIGPTSLMENWPSLKRIAKDDFQAHREVWSVFHESRRHDEHLSHVREWVRNCFLSNSQEVVA